MAETSLRTCQHHGLSDFYKTGPKRWRCKKCNVEGASKRRRKLKQMALEYKGGKCERCGYCKSAYALEFHHTDPTQKDFGIGADGLTRSWEKTKVELDKCILLCANCHREEHERLEFIGQ